MAGQLVEQLRNRLSSNVDYEKISRLVAQLNQRSDNFDLRLTTNVKYSLLLSKLMDISKNLGYDNACKQFKSWQSDLELITFGELRKTVFNDKEIQISIMSTDYSKPIDFEVLLANLLTNIDDRVNCMFAEGFITYTLGKLGYGKTDFNLHVSEIGIAKLGKTMLTNILVVPNPKIIIINSDIEFFRAYLKYKKDLHLVLDEAGIFASSKRAMDMKAVYIEKLLLLSRKFRCSSMFINQRDKLTLPTIRELSSLCIEKNDLNQAIFEYKDDVRIPVFNIEASKIPYETYSIASFRFKLDLDRVLEELSALRPKEMHKKLKHILDNEATYYNDDWIEFLKKKEKAEA